MTNNGRRAVIVDGARTPFAKAFTDLVEMDTIALGAAATRAVLDRSELPLGELDGIVWGGVILPAAAPNVAREIALDLKLPASVEGMTVTRACASGLQAVTIAAASIERGDAEVLVAGGSDSTSNAQVTLPPKLVQKLGPLALGKGGSVMDYIQALSQLRPITEVLPRMPRIAERTTGEVMGEAAERMAKRNGDKPRGTGRVRRAIASPGGQGDRDGTFRARSRPGDDSRRSRGAHRRHRSGGHGPRKARSASTRVRQRRQRDGRQLESAHRRGRRRPRHERAKGPSARLRAARCPQELELRRRRPG
jgi:acetyl-CoA acyltransferase